MLRRTSFNFFSLYSIDEHTTPRSIVVEHLCYFQVLAIMITTNIPFGGHKPITATGYIPNSETAGS